MQLPDTAIAARARLLMKRPFFATHLLTKCNLVYDPAIKTAQTNGKTHQVGDWFCQRPLPQRVFVLAHETLHDILEHPRRAKMYLKRGFGPDMQLFQKKRWDNACDYYINSLLVEDKVGEMPPEGLLDPRYNHTMTVDDIYMMLPPTEDDDDGDGRQDGFDEHAIPDDEPGTGDGDGGGDGDGQELTESQINERVKANLKECEAAEKSQGHGLPGGLARLVGAMTDPKIPWAEECRQFAMAVPGREEVTWARINRRRLCGPPYLPYPGRDGHQINALVLAIDCSGSISPQDLSEFMAEMKAIMEDLSPRETWVLWWDTAVNAVEITDADDLESLTAYGGGGTDYSCVPAWLDANGLEPDLIIAMTDLFVAWPHPDRIRWPHLTVGTYKSYLAPAAPFGKTLYIHD